MPGNDINALVSHCTSIDINAGYREKIDCFATVGHCCPQFLVLPRRGKVPQISCNGSPLFGLLVYVRETGAFYQSALGVSERIRVRMSISNLYEVGRGYLEYLSILIL